ncbi:MAG: NAD(P)-dependent oxidoreductase, partial [Hungatella hathewayi]|nr:NAD(P)-dependent oxidoreductase [Hungatella hathewayi]
MKVVICQGEAIGGRPSREELIRYWKEQLKEIPEVDEVVFHNGFSSRKKDEIAGDADALLGAWIQDCCEETFLSNHPRLKYLASFAHGYGEFDRDAAEKHHITMTNTVYGDVTIAQFAMALLLDICHNVRLQDEYYKKCMDRHEIIGFGGGLRVQSRQIELFEKTMGIIGLGSIGLWTARMAAGFGMKVISFSRHKKTGPEYDFIEQVGLEELFLRSDVISIHCPLTDESYHMIDRAAIEKMKDGVILINTARGAVIDEEALIGALDSGKIYAAGLDVVDNEPLK